MKINFDAPILDHKNRPMPVDETPDSENATLRTVAQQALLASFPDEVQTPIADSEKVKRWRLFNKIDKPGEIDVTSGEIVLIKTLIGKGFPVLIVGRAFDLIEPTDDLAEAAE